MFYQHYKGNIYFTLGVTTYLKDSDEWANKFFNATHTEEGYDISIYMMNARFYVMCESDAGLMLYMDGNGRIWLRPRDMFHGYIEVDGKEVKRFDPVARYNMNAK
jgi:hypothetical protein